MRVRDIIHRGGPRLRLALAAGQDGDGAVIRLSDPASADEPAILLDLYGGELLAGFLMSARVTAAGELSDERCSGDYPFELRMCRATGQALVELSQQDQRLTLARPLWDRLYTELQLVLAHGRHLAANHPRIGLLRDGRRLLH